MRIAIITPGDVGLADEEFKVVGLLGVLLQASFFLFFEFLDTFLLVCRKAQFLFITPKDAGSGLHRAFGHDLVQIGHLVLAVITHEDQHGSLPRDNRPL